MIRIIILVVGVFLLWLLFFSSFAKKKKIIIGSFAVALLAVGLWYESRGNTPKAGLIKVSEVISCGTSAEFSYRSNYNVTVCLQNNSVSATVKRLELRVSVLSCVDSECREIDFAEKGVSLQIEPNQRVTKTLNLPFANLEPSMPSLNWVVETKSVRATY
jgi:hypothetical protein